jgi:hypothetical protein
MPQTRPSSTPATPGSKKERKKEIERKREKEK